MYEIKKQYSFTGFPEDENSLNYPIEIFQESINKPFIEYLVNFNYLQRVLDNYGLTKEDCMYIGDSPNDSPMFGCFPLSVGVSSVLNYRDIMENLPTYITDSDGANGFIELVDLIFSTK